MIFKTEQEKKSLREAGKAACSVLDFVSPYVKDGVSTEELNFLCHNYMINELNVIPAPLNYKNYPKSICTSINHVVCHGIPDEKIRLKDGDIINIDVTVIKNGWYGDTSRMFYVGTPSEIAKSLCETTYNAMWEGIKQVGPGRKTGVIGYAIEDYIRQTKFSIVKNYCGHGIGKEFHTEPQILHFGNADSGMIMEPGMVFTIEPMINEGTPFNKTLNDKWTVVTTDGKLSAQWEHTILVTNDGYEVLTTQ